MEKLCVYSSQALNLFDFINIDYNEPVLEYCVGPCAINRNKLLDINGGFLEDIEFAKQNVIVIFDGKSRFKEVVFNCRNIGKKNQSGSAHFIYEFNDKFTFSKFILILHCLIFCLLNKINPILFYEHRGFLVVNNLFPDNVDNVNKRGIFNATSKITRLFVRNILYLFKVDNIVVEFIR